MANLVKTVLTFDDGSVQEFDAAPVVVTPAPIVTEVDVKESDGSEVVATPEATA